MLWVGLGYYTSINVLCACCRIIKCLNCSCYVSMCGVSVGKSQCCSVVLVVFVGFVI